MADQAQTLMRELWHGLGGWWWIASTLLAVYLAHQLGGFLFPDNRLASGVFVYIGSFGFGIAWADYHKRKDRKR